jgi:hypothetical protein
MPSKTFITTVALALLGACCGPTGAGASGTPSGGLPQGSEPVTLDPAAFTTTIDNRYLPLAPGSRWIYREDVGGGRTQRITVTVTRRTKKVAAGVTACVVHDFATERGALVEDTNDWYAQDAHGNVWYLGEETAEYRHGKVSSREGSWEAGVDGAQPGVVMPAHPRLGLSYRQEYYAGHAEDRAQVLALGAQARVPFGHVAHLLVTKEFSPLEPKATERKYYSAGVGQVLSVSRTGDREELVSFRRGG